MAELVATQKVDQASVDDGDHGGGSLGPEMNPPPGSQGGGEDGFAQILHAFKEVENAQQGKPPEPAPTPPPPTEAPAPTPPAPKPPAPAPAPAKETPPAEPAPATDPNDPPLIQGKVGESFAKLKQAQKERMAAKDAEIERLRADITQTPQTATVSPQLEALQKERDSLLAEKEQWAAQIEKTNLAASPRFNAKYIPRVESALATIKDAAGDNADQLSQIAQVPPGPHRRQLIDNAIGELSIADQARIGTAIATLDQVNSEKNSELSNHKQTLENLTAQDRLAQAQASKVESLRLDETISRVLSHATKELEAFKEIEGDDAHNASIQETIAEVAMCLRGEAPADVIPYLPILAAEGNYLKTHKVPAMQAEIDSLKNTISKLTGSTASPADGVSTTEKPGDGAEAPTFMSTFMKNFPGQ